MPMGCSGYAWLFGPGGSGAGCALFHLHDASAARNAEPNGAAIGCALACGIEQDAHGGGRAAAYFRKHAPAVYIQLVLVVALDRGNFAGGWADLQVDRGAALGVSDFPAMVPSSGGINIDTATALDGLGASVVEGGCESFGGAANAPALDEGGETGACQRRQHGNDGHHHHDFKKRKPPHVPSGGNAQRHARGAVIRQKKRHVIHGNEYMPADQRA